MSDRTANALRTVAALLTTGSGLAQIGALWFRELTGLAVIDAIAGAIYLILALGLFGRSRFSLFMGIILPGTAIAIFSWFPSDIPNLQVQRQSVDAVIAGLSLIALWRVRSIPTP